MKKKRIVKLEPQTVELFAEVLSKLRPPPPLTVSQWADRYRVLSAESSAEPGRWHTEKAPYQRAIMDAIGDPHVRSVVVMSAAQIGKTDAFILNPLGYYMDYAPCPVMCMEKLLGYTKRCTAHLEHIIYIVEPHERSPAYIAAAPSGMATSCTVKVPGRIKPREIGAKAYVAGAVGRSKMQVAVALPGAVEAKAVKARAFTAGTVERSHTAINIVIGGQTT